MRGWFSQHRGWLYSALVVALACGRTTVGAACPQGTDVVSGLCVCSTDDGCPAGEACGDRRRRNLAVSRQRRSAARSSATAGMPTGAPAAAAPRAVVPPAMPSTLSSANAPAPPPAAARRVLPSIPRASAASAPPMPAVRWERTGIPPSRPAPAPSDSCCPEGYIYDQVRGNCTCGSQSCCPQDYTYDPDVRACVCSGTVHRLPARLQRRQRALLRLRPGLRREPGLRFRRRGLPLHRRPGVPERLLLQQRPLVPIALGLRQRRRLPERLFLRRHDLGLHDGPVHPRLAVRARGDLRGERAMRPPAAAAMPICQRRAGAAAAVPGQCSDACTADDFCPTGDFCETDAGICFDTGTPWCVGCGSGCQLCLATLIEGQETDFCAVPCLETIRIARAASSARV